MITMIIMIAKQNEGIVKEFLPDVEFKSQTTNTCSFEVSNSTFQKLCNQVKGKGYNPFALFYW